VNKRAEQTRGDADGVEAPERAWDWRRGWGGVSPSHEYETFHAYDVNDNAACVPSIGLMESKDEPNEGSKFCETCMDIVRSTPEGRPKRRAGGSDD
jgi:hypothetical protein